VRARRARGDLLAAIAVMCLAGCAASGTSVAPATVPPTTVPPTTVPPTSAPTTSVPATSVPATTVAPTTVPATTVPATTVPPTPRVSLAFTGDIVAHRAVNRYAAQPDGSYDYTHMFDNVAPLLQSFDLAICHLEQPVSPDDDVIIPPMKLSVAAQIAPAIATAGYDRCSTASNHSLDRGTAGIDATVNALEAAGVAQSGMARRPEEVLPEVINVNGMRIAHLSYTFSFNGLPPIPGEPWRSNLIEPERVVADARAMRELGAEAVIVSFHWGVERGVQPTSEQRRVAEAVTASGAVDLIVGHHAHVLQPIEQVNGIWVIWGMGNVLSDHPTSSTWPAQSQDAAVFTTALQRNDDGSITVDRPVVYPTWCDTEAGYRIRLTSEADDPSAPIDEAVRAQLRISRERTAALLGDYLAP
jgi:poly-gamma-glutamate capsule biosynthesis protein CapA/YwtB (metallophosphatase superfamily)